MTRTDHGTCTVTELGGWAVSLAQVVGPFFLAQPDHMFAIDRFHPSGPATDVRPRPCSPASSPPSGTATGCRTGTTPTTLP